MRSSVSAFVVAAFVASPFTLLATGFLFATLTPGATAQHREHNPVFTMLLDQGIETSDGKPHPLPKPIMADGLSAEEQAAVIKSQLGGKPIDGYLRNSVMAPHICKLADGAKTDDYIIRKVDYWFIAYADIEKLSADEFSATTDAADDTTSTEISANELSSRNIPPPTTETEQVLGEGYGHLRYKLLNKVEVAAAGRGFVSRKPESILAAALVDQRFSSDTQYPNEWRPLTRNDVGKLIVGDPNPYDGGAGYLKATKLKGLGKDAGSLGAVFVEGHVLLVEPHGWFRGRNQLRGKLPAIVQSQIRDVRRGMLKASK